MQNRMAFRDSLSCLNPDDHIAHAPEYAALPPDARLIVTKAVGGWARNFHPGTTQRQKPPELGVSFSCDQTALHECLRIVAGKTLLVYAIHGLPGFAYSSASLAENFKQFA
jgi:hypothetical protein